MSNYIYLSNYNRIGDLGLSSNVFLSIAEHSLDEIRNLIKCKKNKNGNEIQVSFKNNTVIYKFNLVVSHGISKEYIDKTLKEVLINNLLIICDAIPFQIYTKISYDN